MEKVFKICCPCICMSLCVIMFLVCCLTNKVGNLDWNLCSIVFLIALLVVFIICICILFYFWYLNKKYLSEIKNIQEQITESYKSLKESSLLLKNSSDSNDGIYKTIEKIVEIFCNKNCNDTKLKTFKDVVDAIIKSYESDRKTLSNSGQSQKEENNDPDSNKDNKNKQ